MNSPDNTSVAALIMKWVGRMLCLSAVVLPLSLWAAEGGTGRIVGTVSNAETGDYLEGALVEVPALGKSATTNRRGEFSFGNVAAGDYKVTVSYAGLDPKTLDASVAEGGTVALEAKLTAEVYQLETYTITGVKEGNAAALTAQKNAANVVNLVSLDAFGDVADGNIGNFLQKLPGIDVSRSNGDVNGFGIRGIPQALSTVSMDGEMLPAAFAGDGGAGDRAYPIDNMPAELISNLKVTKSPTPDMPADSLGGNVDLKSKSAMDFTGRRVTYRLSLNNNLDRSGTDWTPSGAFTYMDRFGDRGQTGVTVTGSYAKSINTRDYNQNSYRYYPPEETAPDRYVFLSELRLIDDTFERVRMGTSLKFEHKFSDNILVFLDGTYTKLNYTMERYDYRIATVERNKDTGVITGMQPGGTSTYFASSSASPSTFAAYSDRDNDMYKIGAGADIKLKSGSIKIRASHSEGNSDYLSYSLCASYTRANGALGVEVDSRGGRERPKVTQLPGGPTTMFYGTNLDLYGGNQWLYNRASVTDKLDGTGIDWQWDNPGDLRFIKFLKTGLFYRMKDYNQLELSSRYSYNAINGGSMAQFANQEPGYRLFDGYYPAFTTLDVNKGLEKFRNNPSTTVFTPNRVALSSGIPSIADEDIAAMYLMGQVDYKRLSITLGVRSEHTRQKGTGGVINGYKALEEFLPGTRFDRLDQSYTDFFPGIHLRYLANANTVLRVSWSQSMGRPSLAKQTPGYSSNSDTTTMDAEDDQSGKGYVEVSNTDLKPMYSNNFDISAEYYFKQVGVLSLGAFMKRMDGFIYTVRTTIPEAPQFYPYEDFTLRTEMNMENVAKVQGLELNYSQMLTFLPSFLKDTTLLFNFTWQESSGDFGDGAPTDDLIGFKPLILNVGFNYKYRKFQMQAMFNYSKGYFARYNSSKSNGMNDTFWRDDDMTVDLEFKYRFRKMDFFLAINNILNYSPNTYILNNKSMVRTYETNGARIALGVSGRF